MKKMHQIGQLLDVSSADPDDARRRKLLNILLVGVAFIAFVGIILVGLASIIGLVQSGDATRLVSGLSIALLGFIILLLINRYWLGWLASTLFVLFLTSVISIADTPQMVVEGRTLFLFAIPILVASVVLPPWASFGAAAACSVAVSLVAMRELGWAPPIPSMFGFFAIALVSWISARSLEQALFEVRDINRHLDGLVQERTRELADALGQTRAILNSIADGVAVFDMDGRVMVANPSLFKLIDRTAEQVIGSDLDGMMAQDVVSTDRSVLLDLMSGSSPSYAALRVEWGKKTLSVSGASVYVEQERIGMVMVFRDFTREAELERMKSAFVAMVSHELRTPLNAILGYADMLNEGILGDLTIRQSDVIRRVMANARRQLSLVNDLLDQAQIEAGTLSLNYSPIMPSQLVHDVHAAISVLAEAKGVALTTRIEPDVPAEFSGDSQRLHQILINLVNNAIKFTEEGEISVRIFCPDLTHWAIQVSDTGVGIPEEASEYLFEPFRRVDGSATRKQSGVGLGLSIVKQIVTLMQGQVSWSSQLGKGSIFTVVLPIIPLQPHRRISHE